MGSGHTSPSISDLLYGRDNHLLAAAEIFARRYGLPKMKSRGTAMIVKSGTMCLASPEKYTVKMQFLRRL